MQDSFGERNSPQRRRSMSTEPLAATAVDEAAAFELRYDWARAEVEAIYRTAIPELVFRAQTVHRRFHAPDRVQTCQLISIKTGGCPEDCAYCPQSAHYDADVERQGLLDPEHVVGVAREAAARGVTRFCMGAAWRQAPEGREFEKVLEMVRGVSALGMEVCCTLGMLKEEQAVQLKEAGLSAYNHNLDTSPEFYGSIITTRVYEDRLKTLAAVRRAGITVCCGGILGMGERESDRVGLLQQLAALRPHPESVPINMLVRVEGTPLANVPTLDPMEMVRAIATARNRMPAETGNSILKELQRELLELEQKFQRRSLARVAGVSFCSNDYLGLAEHAGLRDFVAEAVRRVGQVGSTGSRLLSGHHTAWDEIENQFATFAGTEAALYFGSGYAANLGLLTSLLSKNDLVFSDELNHASIIDGIRLSGARKEIYRHGDLNALEAALRRHEGEQRRKIVVTESVFSMDGDVADVREIVELAERFGAGVIVDEAHATAVHGPEGRGIVAETGTTERVLGVLHTCGKALASVGGFVCGS